jgi:hypothetical protein
LSVMTLMETVLLGSAVVALIIGVVLVLRGA